MTFGTLEPCNVCKGGQFVFSQGGYKCNGDLTEWSKCNTLEKEPKRTAFKVPSNLAEAHSFLKKYKYVPKIRIIKQQAPAVVKKEEENAE